MNLNIFVSKQCFVYCKGCYSYSREEKCESVLPTTCIVNFLRYAYNNGITKVTLCGGDPFARDDIIELLTEIKDIGFIVSIDTVGTSLLKDVILGKNVIKKIDVKKLPMLVDNIGIPIDGSNNDIFKLFRSTPTNILDEELSVCKLLVDNNIKVSINTVAHKGNIHDFMELSKLIKSINGVYKWQIFQYASLGKYGYMNRDLFQISEEEFDIMKNEVLKQLSDSEILVDFKKSKDRINHYMLIDNSGNAWVPEYERIITNSDSFSERLVIGNITKENEWYKICQYVKQNIK